MSAAIILAGGQSRRMGQDKASIVIAGKALLQHVIDRVAPLVEEIVVVKRPCQELPPIAVGPPYPAHVWHAEDLYPGKGPLGGLHTGLASATSFPAIAVACDMPLLRTSLLEELLRLSPGFDAVVPVRLGQPEPLCAVYAASCLDVIRGRLERDHLRISNLAEDLHTCFVSEAGWQRFDPDGLSFFNLNTPEDLARAEALLESVGETRPEEVRMRENEVDAWFAASQHPMKDVMQLVRQAILAADGRVEESVKWKTPTFSFRGNVASINPQARKYVSLMFHRGADIPGDYPSLHGEGAVARYMQFEDAADVQAKSEELSRAVRAWCDLKAKA